MNNIRKYLWIEENNKYQSFRNISFSLFSLFMIWESNANELNWNTTIDSFKKATSILNKSVYHDDRTEFYCGMKFDEELNIISFNWFDATKYEKFENKIQWDHIVPAENFWRSFIEWREWNNNCIDNNWKAFKWRKCAEKTSIEYRLMQADMYNLVPANWAINVNRWNKQFGMIEWEKREFWTCNVEIDNEMKKIEPNENIMWDIARIYMYMDSTYPWHWIISDQRKKLFEAWDHMDPIDEKEVKRAKRIEKIQWNTNYIIKERAIKAWLRDKF